MQPPKTPIPIGMAKLSKKSQIVLPKPLRTMLGVKPRDEVVMIGWRDEVRLMKKPKDWVSYARGLGKETWEKLGGGEVYIKRERESWSE